jgi:hypothetical protein
MSLLSRDKQILALVLRAYDFQIDLRERLDSKLNNFVAITGTVSTLSVGVALFVFERVKQDNPSFLPLIFTFSLFFGLLIAAMMIGLIGYRPTALTLYPEDPERAIAEYSNFPTETHVIRTVAASLAEVTRRNIELNNQKSRICQWVFYLLIIGAVIFVIFTLIMVFTLGYSSPAVIPSNTTIPSSFR